MYNLHRPQSILVTLYMLVQSAIANMHFTTFTEWSCNKVKSNTARLGEGFGATMLN